LPLLEWDDEEVGQSLTIARFVAGKTHLAGHNDVERARAEAIVDAMMEGEDALTGAIFGPTEEIRKAKGEELLGKKLPKFLNVTENLLKKRGGKWVTGNMLSGADIAIFNHLGDILDEKQLIHVSGHEKRAALIEEHPLVKNLIMRVGEIPAVKYWVETRPKTNS